jgi:hypothetical protein
MIGFAAVGGAVIGIYMAIIDRIKKCRHRQPDTSQPARPTLNSLRTQFGS